MKKIVALPLIVAVAMGAAACTKKTDAANNADVSADLNAAANDAIADVNAATADATDNSAAAAGQRRRDRRQHVERAVIIRAGLRARPMTGKAACAPTGAAAFLVLVASIAHKAGASS